MRVWILHMRPVWLAVLGVVLAAACFGIGKGVQTVQTAAAEQKRPIYSVETTEKKVALGINCAWDAEDIPTLLALLEERQISATFFVVGQWCDTFPDAVRSIDAAGHEIGTHSDTHADMATLDREGIVRELRDSASKVEALIGKRPTLFRPPSGSYNTLVIETAEQEGFYPIQWDCDSVDYKNPTAQQMQDRILRYLREGSILLFHSGAQNTPEALPQILDAIQALGYTFVPVSELIYPAPYTVDFEGRQHPAAA